jgi:hypothetical protein
MKRRHFGFRIQNSERRRRTAEAWEHKMSDKSPDDAGQMSRRSALGLVAAAPVAVGALATGGPAVAAAPGPGAGIGYDPSRERLYSHELINMPVPGRQPYLNWFNTWPAKVRAETQGACRNYGIWATVGMSHRWAEALVMWEYRDKAAMAGLMNASWNYIAHDDPASDHYTRFWKDAPEGVVDTTGMDRLMCSTPWSPTLEELTATIKNPAAYLHYDITTQPGDIHRHLRDLNDQYIPIAQRLGLDFVGAFRTLLVNDDQGLAIFSMKSFQNWADFENRRRSDPAMLAWRNKIAREGVTLDGRMVIGSRVNPLRTGVIL